MTTRQDEPLRRTRYLAVLVVAAVTLHAATARPQALKVSTEIQAGPDRRWDDAGHPTRDVELRDEERKLMEIAKSFRQSRSLHLALMEVLKGLTEEEVKVLERALAAGEEPQADMPVEDLVEDSPQELPGEDAGEELSGYRGELLVLDNINSSSPNPSHLNFSEPVDEQFLPQLQKINREKFFNISLERLKEMRLATIKNQIMNILWPVGTPPSFSSNSSTAPQHDLLRAIADKMKTQSNSFTPGDVYTEKIQSFYPSCETPRNTDAELWSYSESMNLLFDLSYPTPLQGTQVNIVAAKLRLYKLSQGNVSMGLDNCPPAESEEVPSKQQYPTFTEEKMIRVSIYWYTRSLKKHRVKRKLLDSQMVSVYGESWTEWNIRGAVKAWRDNGRNFGLAVEVEDEDGVQLPTHNYFAPMNCSLEASTSRPIPGFLVARALAADSASNNTNHSLGQALRYDTLLFPMIDLCTIEFPESEKQNAVYYHKVVENDEDNVRKSNLKVSHKQQNTTSNAPVSLPTSISSGAEKHKTRHQNHKHKDENHQSLPQVQPQNHKHLETVRRDDGDSIEEITWADDLDGHQLRKQIIVQKVIMKPQNNDQDNER